VIKKCKFHTKKTDFVKFIIKLRQISMDPKKIKAIISWQYPKSVTGLRLFLRFCNYYKRFIANWLNEIESFIRIMKKSKFWNWDDQKSKLFRNIKSKFIEKPILKIYQPKLLIKVETNVLDFALRTCFLQKHDKV